MTRRAADRQARGWPLFCPREPSGRGLSFAISLTAAASICMIFRLPLLRSGQLTAPAGLRTH